MYEKVRLNLFFWLLTEAVQVVALFTKERQPLAKVTQTFSRLASIFK